MITYLYNLVSMVSHNPVLHGSWSQDRLLLLYRLQLLPAIFLSRVEVSNPYTRQPSPTTFVEDFRRVLGTHTRDLSA